MAELATLPPAKTLEKLLIDGDLSSLNAQERLDYYARVCESLGLNPLTKPFAYIKLNGKLVLYALKNCAEQLRKIHGVSVTAMTMQTINEVYVVSAEFKDKSGRVDQATGCVPIKGLSGENLANAFLKAETKCKNRGTYSICGLGMLDETEVESIPDAEKAGEEKFKRLKPATASLLRDAGAAADAGQDDAANELVDEAVRTMAELDVPQEPDSDSSPLGSPTSVPAARPALAITHVQHKALEASIREFCAAFGMAHDETRERIKQRMAADLGVAHFPELN